MNIPPALPNNTKPTLTWYQHVWIGWPILLMFVGGGIGGACGGGAWALNQKVFHSTKGPMRYLWTGLISIAAIITYVILAMVFLSFFPKES